MEIKDEQLKELRLGFKYQRAFEEAFREYPLKEIYKKLKKELYGIDRDSKKTTKKKI